MTQCSQYSTKAEVDNGDKIIGMVKHQVGIELCQDLIDFQSLGRRLNTLKDPAHV